MSAPALAAILLAAGASRRLGQPKALVEFDGEALVRRTARRLAAAAPQSLLVVTGDPALATRIMAALEGLDVREVRCAAWKDGMGASLRAGLAAAAGLPVDAALVCPCDLPRLEAPQVEALVAAWRADPARPAACRYAGVVGTPAIIPRAAFDAAAAEGGDHGARGWLRRQPVLSLVDAPGLAFDVDERGDLPQPR